MWLQSFPIIISKTERQQRGECSGLMVRTKETLRYLRLNRILKVKSTALISELSLHQ